MGLYAYDTKNDRKIEAKDAVKKAKGRYLCLECKKLKKDVPLFLTETDNGKYFKSYQISDHLADCDFVSATDSKYRNVSINNFDFEALYSSLFDENEPKPKEKDTHSFTKKDSNASKDTIDLNPTTLRKLYHICMSNELSFNLGDEENPITVDDICVSARNADKWKKDSWNNKLLLVVGHLSYVDFEEYRVHLEINQKLKIILEFPFSDVFAQFCEQREQYRKKSRLKIFVLGKFDEKSYTMIKENDNEEIKYQRNAVQILSSKQIVFLSRGKKL